MNINAINPVASGNKTQSGIGGLLTVLVGAAVGYGLNALGVTDEQASVIAGAVTSTVVSGVLAIVGVIHKRIKAKKEHVTVK